MFDLFTNDQNYYIRNSRNFKHPISGLLSLIFIIIAVPLSYDIAKDFLWGKNPKMQNFANPALPSDWPIQPYHLMLQYPRDALNRTFIVDNLANYGTYSLFTWKECTDEEYSRFSNEKRNSDMV